MDRFGEAPVYVYTCTKFVKYYCHYCPVYFIMNCDSSPDFQFFIFDLFAAREDSIDYIYNILN